MQGRPIPCILDFGHPGPVLERVRRQEMHAPGPGIVAKGHQSSAQVTASRRIEPALRPLPARAGGLHRPHT